MEIDTQDRQLHLFFYFVKFPHFEMNIVSLAMFEECGVFCMFLVACKRFQ